jgi:hypothetical protein
MKANFVIAGLLTIGYAADMRYFNGVYSHAASLILGDIMRHFF